MPDLLVRGVEEEIVRALNARAGAHGRSAEAEHRAILAAALTRPRRSKLGPGSVVHAASQLRCVFLAVYARLVARGVFDSH